MNMLDNYQIKFWQHGVQHSAQLVEGEQMNVG